MPFTFFSHQAPALPLKLIAPRWLSGTALALGSMAPDFEYFWRGVPISDIGHTPLGQVAWCMPWTLLAVWLVRRVIAEPLALHLPDCGPFRLREYGRLACADDGPSYWARAAWSSVVGSWSHVIFDSFTHQHGWIVDHTPLLQGPVPGTSIPFYIALNHGGTVFGGAFTLALLYSIGKRHRLADWQGPAAPFETRRSTPRVRSGCGRRSYCSQWLDSASVSCLRLRSRPAFRCGSACSCVSAFSGFSGSAWAASSPARPPAEAR